MTNNRVDRLDGGSSLVEIIEILRRSIRDDVSTDVQHEMEAFRNDFFSFYKYTERDE